MSKSAEQSFPIGSRWWHGAVQIEVTAFDVVTQRLSYTNVAGCGGGHMGSGHWERLVRA